MTNVAHQVGTGVVEVVQKQVSEVTNALVAEVSQGRQALNTALLWLVERGATFVVNLLVAALLLLIGAYLVCLLTRTTRSTLKRSGKINALLENFLCSVVNKSCWALLLMVVLQRLGVNIAPLIAGLGVTGFILGFAFQESLGNLAAGMMIAINQPFQVGDYVSVGGIEGAVQELNMMATTLATGDNKKVVVPNKIVWGAAITNFTASDRRRVDVAIGIAYGEDIGKAKRIALEVLRAHPLVLADPAPLVEVLTLGESAVNLVIRPWSKPADYWAVYFSVIQSVKEAFDQNGVAIPFPQLDVHMKS